ncbi:hypothetical protein JCM33374_g1353 [Metschnikowia sp. JCM 33374]|nr:hypothetical protein JCM33374_g1353 [Metschnikowia sp. JCM 33374]
MDAITSLRQAIIAHHPIDLKVVGDTEQDATSIQDATHVRIGSGASSKLFSLDEKTHFYNEDEQQTLRPVVFCWNHEKSSIVDYKTACLEHHVADFKFLVKAELTTWLSGRSDSCKFIKNTDSSKRSSTDNSETSGSASNKRKSDDPQMARIAEYELDSLDHNAALRGTKNILLKNLISDAKRFTTQLKRSKPSKTNIPGATVSKKQPIIIVSPATTALLSLSNIKEFLEEGRFVEPTLKRSENNVVTISRPSDRFVPAAQSIMVVDNVDLFTKPEYWDRVIAIFTTGQTWQFAKFKYSRPEILFQHYHGFYMGYQGDIVPKQIKDWNVSVIAVDRGEKRFRDKMIVRDLWSQLDKTLAAKNYGV